MTKCKIISLDFTEILDIDLVLATLIGDFLNTNLDDSLIQLKLPELKRLILERFVRDTFRKSYVIAEEVDAPLLLQNFISNYLGEVFDMFFGDSSIVSPAIPTKEDIALYLRDDLIEQSETTPNSTTSRIEKVNDIEILRNNLYNRFLSKAFGFSYNTRNYATTIGTEGILNAVILDRKNGQPIKTIEDINVNIRKFQLELFNNLVQFYESYTGTEAPTDKLYETYGVSPVALSMISKLKREILNPETLSPMILDRMYVSMLNGEASKTLKLQYNAYISLVLLDNFDAFVRGSFGKSIKIKSGSRKYSLNNDKYTIADKGDNMNKSYRVSDSIDIHAEVDNIVKQLINTTPRYSYGSETPLPYTYLSYLLFTTIINKIKELASSFSQDVFFGNFMDSRWDYLSDETKNALRNMSLKLAISKMSSDTETLFPAIIEVLTRKHNYELLNGFTKDDYAIIQSIHKGITTSNYNTTSKVISIRALMKKNPNPDRDYFEYITQNVQSIFPVSFLLFFTREGNTYARNMVNLAEDRILRNIETAINTKNSKGNVEILSEEPSVNLKLTGYDVIINRYGITERKKRTKLENVIFDPLFKNPELRGKYITVTYMGGDVTFSKFLTKNFTREDYLNLKNFFKDILSINLNDPKYENALLGQYNDVEGRVNYNEVVSDLFTMASHVIRNQYISNVTLANAKTESQIRRVLETIFGENLPSINRQLQEISLFDKVDIAKLEKLSRAAIITQLDGSFTLVSDGEGNGNATSTFSNLLSNYRVQWEEQIKHNEDSAANEFSIMDDGFVKLYRQKELNNSDDKETKLTLDFNLREFTESQIIYGFLDGIAQYNKTRRSDSFLIKNGVISILPSVNSDKVFIGSLLVNLNKKSKLTRTTEGLEIIKDEFGNISIDDTNLTYLEILLSKDADENLKKIILYELGGFYSKARDNINNTLKRAFNLLNINEPFDITDFSRINAWADSLGPDYNLVDALFKATRAYNNTPEGRIDPIELTDLVHFIGKNGRLYVNPTLVSALMIHTDLELLDTFFKKKESQMLRDLVNNSVSIYTDSLNDEQYKALTSLVDVNLWTENGKIILGKFTRNGKTYNISSSTDLLRIQLLPNLGLPLTVVDDCSELAKYGELELNPLFRKFNLIDYLITQEWNSSTVGNYYAHPNKGQLYVLTLTKDNMYSGDIPLFPDFIESDLAARTDASFKRNVSYTASMHTFRINRLNGIADIYNIAVVLDLEDVRFNIVGDSSEIKPTDGGMFVNPFIVLLENNSLKGEKVGVNKKLFVHAYKDETGTQVIIKTAGFGITNETMRMSKFDRVLMEKMTNRQWINQFGEPISINILQGYNGAINYGNPNSREGRLYYKENGEYYELLIDRCSKVTGKPNTYVKVFLKVDKNGAPIAEVDSKEVVVDSNYSLWLFFGGMNSMEIEGDTLIPSEISILNVVKAMNSIVYGRVKNAGVDYALYMTSNSSHWDSEPKQLDENIFLPLKHSDIHYVCGAGSVKCGAANINAKEAFTSRNPDGTIIPLNTMRIKLNLIGILLDKEHKATGEDLSMMTLVISACISRGYTLKQALDIYNGLYSLTMQQISKYNDAAIEMEKTGDRKTFERIIVSTILELAANQSLNNNRLEAIIKPLLTKYQKGEEVTLDDIEAAGIPYSNSVIFNKIASMNAVEMTKRGIRVKIDGLLAILCPSHDRVKLYNGRLLNDWERHAEGVTSQDLIDAEQLNSKYTIVGTISQPSKLMEGKSYTIISKDLDGNTDIQRGYIANGSETSNPDSITLDEEYLQGRTLILNYDGNFYNVVKINSADDIDLLTDNIESLLSITDVSTIADINIGRTYLITTFTGKTYLKTITLPSEYLKLKSLVLKGQVIGIKEHIIEGRNLGGYNCRFTDTNGNRYQLYDLYSALKLFELLDNDPNNEAVIWRRKVQEDLAAISKGGTVTVITDFDDEGRPISEDVLTTGEKVTLAYETVLPKKFAEEFGLRKGDSLEDIKLNKMFFVDRIIERFGISPEMREAHENWDIALKRLNGKHIYILDRSHLDETSNLHQKEDVELISGDSGEIIRINPENLKEMYTLGDASDEIWEDEQGNEVIVTDDLGYYVDNFSYSGIELSASTIQRNSENTDRYNNYMEEIIGNLLVSDNEVAKEWVSHFIDEDGESVNLEEVNAINIRLNSPEYLRLNKAILKSGREIYTSFLRSLDIVAARIPAQSMQSFMPMVVVGFVESDINTAYVSSDQIWLQGSDFDIDAVSLAMFSFDLNGVYYRWSPYMDLSSIENLKKSEELPLPTGIKTLTIDTEEVELPLTLFNIRRRTIKGKKTIKVNFNFRSYSELCTFFNLVNANGGLLWCSNIDKLTKYFEDNFGLKLSKNEILSVKDLILKLVDRHNLYLKNLKSDSDRTNAIKNFNMHKMYAISSDPINAIESLTSVDSTTGEPKRIANTSYLTKLQRSRTYGNWMNKAAAIIENQIGKKCVGISANGLKGFFALTQYFDSILNNNTISDSEKASRLLFRDPVQERYVPKLLANSRVIDPESIKDTRLKQVVENINLDEDAAIVLSAILSLATDNAKELALAKLNAGINMLGLYVFAIMTGTDFKTITNVMMSKPAIIINSLMEGNVFGINLLLNSLESVFDYIELGPNLAINKLSENIYTSSRNTSIKKEAENAIIEKFKSIITDKKILEVLNNRKLTLANKLAVIAGLVKDYNLLLTCLDVLEQVKAGLYKNEKSLQNKTTFSHVDTSWKIIRFFDFLLDYFRQVYAIKGTPEAAMNYKVFKRFASGAAEIRTLGNMLGLNLGLPTSSEELLSKVNSIETCIDNIINSHVRKHRRDYFSSKYSFPKSQKENSKRFDLISFIRDSEVRKKVIDEYLQVKQNFNILDVITTNELYLGYLTSLVLALEQDSMSAKFRALRTGGILAVELQNARTLKDVQDIHKGVSKLVDEVLRDSWLKTSKYGVFILPKGQYTYSDNGFGKLVRSENKTTSDTKIYLGTPAGLATFKHYMESYVIPRILAGKDKSNKKTSLYSDNIFLLDLQPMSFSNLTRDNSPLSAYSLPINMSPQTLFEKSQLLKYKAAFNKLAESSYKFGDYNLLTLFYLYGLIVFNDLVSSTTLTTIFEDMEWSDIDTDRRKFLHDFDINNEIIFEFDFATRKLATVSKDRLIEAVRLRRSPYNTTLNYIYASSNDSLGYSPYNRTSDYISEDDYYIMELLDEEGEASRKKGKYEPAGKKYFSLLENIMEVNGFTIEYNGNKIVSVSWGSKKFPIFKGMELPISRKSVDGVIVPYINAEDVLKWMELKLKCLKK